MTKPVEFRQVLDNAKIRKRLGPIRFYARPNDLEFPRLGLIVGKRGVPLAVDRNRLKRLVRSDFRKRRTTLAPYDIVVQITARLTSDDLKGILADAMPYVGKNALLSKDDDRKN